MHHLWILDGPRKLGQPRSTRGANGSLMEKHFTTLETDFTLVTLLPWRKGTFYLVSRKSSSKSWLSFLLFCPRIPNGFLILTHYGKGAIDQFYLKGMSPKGAVISRVSVNTLTLLHCEWVNKRHATVALKMSSGDCHRGISDHYR